LVEVLAALFLTAIGILAAAPMFISSIQDNAVTADLGSTGAAAVARMELLRQTDYDALPAGGSLTSDVSGYFDVSDPAVTVRWEVVNGGGPAGVKTITVRAIANREVVGLAKVAELTTLRAR